jgi:hypothetical protein
MGVCNKYKPERCKSYLGATCVSGGCPIALRDEYAERGYDIVHNCDECPYYKGCEDCAFEDSNICKEKVNKML